MTLVILSVSGSVFSLTALLKRIVSRGASVSVRSLRIAGEMWKISAALLLSRDFMTSTTCFRVMFCNSSWSICSGLSSI